MPIVERTEDACFRAFGDHVNRLFCRTLDPYPVASLYMLGREGEAKHASLTLGRDGNRWFQLQSDAWGPLRLSILQELRTVPDGRRFRLTTHSYAYHLQPGTDDSKRGRGIRWEYLSKDHDNYKGGRYCRHHFQVNNDWNPHLDIRKGHTPTGWVLIGELIRFLIVDGGVRPYDGWEAAVEEDRQLFFGSFSSLSSGSSQLVLAESLRATLGARPDDETRELADALDGFLERSR